MPNVDLAEEIEIHTADGHALRADVRAPDAALWPVERGVAVLAHAMFARRSEFERPRKRGLARFLAARGWRTIAFDFRGHGDSGPGAERGAVFTYDDFVHRDLPAVVGCARARSEGRPVVVFGHSLGGHVALAAQGLGLLEADAIVAIAANIWLPDLEPSRARWLVKRGVMEAIAKVAKERGYFPARRLRLGSDNESLAYFRAFTRFTRTGIWGSDDGLHDYTLALAQVRIPVVAIASDGDVLNAVPACAERFVRACAGDTRFHVVHRGDDGGRAPGHMEIVTTERAQSAWLFALDALRDLKAT